MPPITGLSDAGDSYFRQLCEHAGIALISCDRDLRIRSWNLAAARMFGPVAEHMIGTTVVSFLSPEGGNAVEDTIRRTLMTGEILTLNLTDRDVAGFRRELAGSVGPILTESGERVGASVCMVDITARLAAQDELQQTRKMMALGQLAGAVAHHFNNILGGVITSVDYATTRNDPAVTQRVLQQINQALPRAAGLVNGLLAFAEGDRRGEDLSDFTEVINDIANDLERSTQGTGVTLSLHVPPLPVLPVGRSQLTTVLRNMTQNALEAMPAGGRLAIDVALVDGRLILRIGDTGHGFDAAGLSHVFEPFWSTKGNLTSATGEGTGLGLAIAHGIVQMMGGEIHVASEPNRGTCFTVSLPLPLRTKTGVEVSVPAGGQ